MQGEFRPSPLFALPGEIREEIFRQLLTGHIIHILAERFNEGPQFGWPQGRVKSNKPRIKSEWCLRDCTYKFNDDGEPGTGRHDFNMDGQWALSVLLTCRQLYQETAGLIYYENVFDFVDVLTFGDFITQFEPLARRIRYLQIRHKEPTLGFYSQRERPASLLAAVRLSYQGPAMLLHFLNLEMQQLKEMKIQFERTWMTTEYEAGATRRHAEWVRFLEQLAELLGESNSIIYAPA